MPSILHDLLEKAELEELYEKYEIKYERTHRNKVILGLLVYQGLTRRELEILWLEHPKLREGKIHIPQVGKIIAEFSTCNPFRSSICRNTIYWSARNYKKKQKGFLWVEVIWKV